MFPFARLYAIFYKFLRVRSRTYAKRAKWPPEMFVMVGRKVVSSKIDFNRNRMLHTRCINSHLIWTLLFHCEIYTQVGARECDERI